MAPAPPRWTPTARVGSSSARATGYTALVTSVDPPSDAGEWWGVPAVSAPGGTHPTPRAALAAILAAYLEVPDAGEHGWITAVAGNGEAVIQVLPGTINFCLRPVDLRAVLREARLEDLVPFVRPDAEKDLFRREDRTLWRVDVADAEVLARILDAAFARGLGLGEAYRLEARFEPSGEPPDHPLAVRVYELSLAGWALFGVFLATFAAVLLALGPWILEALGAGGLRQRPWGVVLLGLASFFVALAVHRLGHALLPRLGLDLVRPRARRHPEPPGDRT